jgi:hypothetical protein
LRQVRAEAGQSGLGWPGAGDTDAGSSFAGERSAIHSLFAAKIEVARRTTPARDRAAAIRAIMDEEHGALQAIAERAQSARVALSERLATDRHAEMKARENERLVFPVARPT